MSNLTAVNTPADTESNAEPSASTPDSSAATPASADSASPTSAASSVASSDASPAASAASSASDESSVVTVHPSPNVVTSIVSQAPPQETTNLITSVVTQPATSDGGVETQAVTVVVTSTNSPSTTSIRTVVASHHTTPSSTSSTPSSLPQASSPTTPGSGNPKGGLSTGGKTAIAVVLPVLAVALFVGAFIWWWRQRKRAKAEREQRRKEVEDYGFNPNSDPTIPKVATEDPEMTQEQGYRGWGAAAPLANKATSASRSGAGHTHNQLSENSLGEMSNGSPEFIPSDKHSGDPLVDAQRQTMDSDDLGALGHAPVSATNTGPRRGPSNASSAYSNTARSDRSDDPIPLPSLHDHPAILGYGQHGPYGDGTYGGAQDGANADMPVVRDVTARRNTQLHTGGNYQANSGIAQNF
ncbi:hypothetical protein K470DRAFT_240158 [Piedraia hortae CBS 480.64]|uniref:Uncharacterized protein n=1 Tax=Piedraia hortae CBS 480.64 TaxID=1314780 RepID=A0A6A7C953_9PEZI|nr:hypothetical protein K470DRAFT_240158 [Piedraia hortae CBS 480.64]